MSANALRLILDTSAQYSSDGESEDTAETRITETISATYVFADAESYYAFEEDVRELGLDDSYTISSSDITSFEDSLDSLNTLSTMAGWFLIVILAIGGIIYFGSPQYL